MGDLLIVALAGPIASGKTSFASEIYERYGITVFKTREYIKQKGSPEERTELQAGGEALDSALGGTWVSDAIKKIIAEKNSATNVILVDSVRTQDQIISLKREFPKVVVIYFTASEETLFNRWKNRDKTFKEALDYNDMKNNQTEAGVVKLLQFSDIVVDTGFEDRQDYMQRLTSRLGLSQAHEKSVDVLIGGQWGSEGKGNVVSYIATEYDVLIRSGGPNAGHKVWEEPKPFCFHHIPSGTRVNKNAKIVLAPGAVLWVPSLMEEIQACGLTPERLFIDPNAMIIEQSDRDFEGGSLVGQIGSTGQGVGSATARKILRSAASTPVRTAKDESTLKQFIRPTIDVLGEAFSEKKKILVEGTQGTGLSLHHGPYPHCTSRDCSVSGVLSEAGIPPHRVRKTIMVCRTYPIRVKSPEGGTSGPMADELTFEEVSKRSGVPLDELTVTETTSTTHKKRRIAEFDWELLRKSTQLNSPTDIALTFADYLSIENRKATKYEELTENSKEFIRGVEKASGAAVSLISTQFHPKGIIDRRNWK